MGVQVEPEYAVSRVGRAHLFVPDISTLQCMVGIGEIHRDFDR